jgi:hypothetical protein
LAFSLGLRYTEKALQETGLRNLTPLEADVVYQLLNASRKLWTPDAFEKKAIRRLTGKGLLAERARGLPHVTEALFDIFRVQVAKMREASKPLRDEDQAVLCTIRQEPEYNFVSSERRMANRLAREGFLRPASVPGRFLVTYGGYTRYSWDPIRRKPLH